MPHPPPDMIGQQGHVESKRQPFSGAQEHYAEKHMDEVLRQDELRKPHKHTVRKTYTDPPQRQSSIAPEACAPNLANRV